PDARVAPDAAVAALLDRQTADARSPAELLSPELLAFFSPGNKAEWPGSADPQDLLDLAMAHGYHAALGRGRADSPGTIDAAFVPSAEDEPRAGLRAPRDPGPEIEAWPWVDFESAAVPLAAAANNPLRNQAISLSRRQLPPKVRDFAARRLPEFMLPSVLMVVDSLPLTDNGKVDRRKLPRPEGARPEWIAEYAPASTPAQEILAAIWADILGLDQVGIHDDFFELGGHSLLAVQIISRIRDRLGVDLPLRTIFEERTMGGIAGQVETLSRADAVPPPGRADAVPVIKPAGRDGLIPMSFAQQRLWVLDQLFPG